MTRGPLPRWKKRLESSMASLNGSLNTTNARSILSMSYNTSLNGPNTLPSFRTPVKSNDPNRTRGNRSMAATPSKPPPKTPSHSTLGDRFIPNRGATNFELGHYLVSSFHPSNVMRKRLSNILIF